MDTPPTSAYVHLPFCKARCHYCDFAVVSGPAAVQRSTHRKVVDAVKREIRATARAARARLALTPAGGPGAAGSGGSASLPPLETVYFGGGTPSLVPPELVGEIVGELDAAIGVAADAEVTIECDPGTFDAASLRGYCDAAGVTRVSVGVQSLVDAELELCNRSHTAAEARQALDAVAGAGFLSSWSVDLIHGLPGQTPASALAGLDDVVGSFSPPHVSLYTLAVEPGTRFASLYSQGEPPLPSDDECADVYAASCERLASAGFDHYEIMSFAKSESARSRHNARYWANEPWYGFGMSAASHTFGRKYSRPRTLAAWLRWVDGGPSAVAADAFAPPPPRCPSTGAPVPPAEWALEAAQDTLILGLRRAEGVELDDVSVVAGDDAAGAVLRACAALPDGDAVVADSARGGVLPRVVLTRPDGFLRENVALRALIGALDTAASRDRRAPL